MEAVGTDISLVWWIAAVEIPVVAGLLGLIFRVDSRVNSALEGMTKAIGVFQTEVANTRATNGYVGEVDRRLTKRMDRVEEKLDDHIADAKRGD